MKIGAEMRPLEITGTSKIAETRTIRERLLSPAGLRGRRRWPRSPSKPGAGVSWLGLERDSQPELDLASELLNRGAYRGVQQHITASQGESTFLRP